MSDFNNIITEEQKHAAIKASTAWQSAIVDDEAVKRHPYILRKQIQPHGIRINLNENKLIIPAYDVEGNIQTIQRVSPESEKKKLFYKGAPKKGNFFSFGDLTTREYILICEGYATGASIFQASNISTVVAFDAGNLKPVTEVISKNYPHSKIIICGDDDFYKKDNVGKNKALSLAEECSCYVVFPEFTEQSKEEKPSDFNDLHVLEGLEVVTEQLNKALIDAGEFYKDKPDPEPQPKYILPDCFQVEDSGVYYIEGKNHPTWLCSKVEVNAYTADENDKNQGLLLKWVSEHSNKPHT